MEPNMQEPRSAKLKRAVWNDRGQLRAGWKILLFAALCLLVTLISVSTHDMITRVLTQNRSVPSSLTNLSLQVSLLIGVLLSSIIALRIADGSPSGALGFSFHDRVGVEALHGVVLGFIMVTLIFMFEWRAGRTQAAWSGLDLHSVGRYASYYVALFAASAAFEEALLRGYAFQALIQGTGKAVAVCLTSVTFGLFHLMNPHVGLLGIVNATLAGAWLSIAYLRTRSLWLPTGLHMSWNLTQGFIFGFPVSGMPISASLVVLNRHGEEWITGGSYGPEGGLPATLVLILGTLYLLYSKNIKPSAKALALWE